jgi:hypothetical protein
MSDVAGSSRSAIQPSVREPVEDWSVLPGRNVEVWCGNRYIRTSRVDAASVDATMIWLSFDGVDMRRLVMKSDGYEVYDFIGPIVLP